MGQVIAEVVQSEGVGHGVRTVMGVWASVGQAGGLGQGMRAESVVSCGSQGLHSEGGMKRVTGIGGIFFKSPDPKALGQWYRTHLGLDVTEWGGALFQWGGEGS